MELLAKKQIDGLGQDKLETLVPKYVERVTSSYYNLGGLLTRIRDRGLFVRWLDTDYSTFDEWCETVLTFGARKALHLINIYNGIQNLNPQPDVTLRLLALGWVKVSQILRVAHSPEGLLKWIKVAEGMSLQELIGKVRFELAKEKSASGDGEEALLQAVTEVEVTRKFHLNETQNAAVDKALDTLKKRSPLMTDGEAIAAISLSYMATHVRDDEGGVVVELSYLLKQIENVFGVKLKIQKPEAAPVKKPKLKMAV